MIKFLKRLRRAWQLAHRADIVYTTHFERRCQVILPETYGGNRIVEAGTTLTVYIERSK